MGIDVDLAARNNRLVRLLAVSLAWATLEILYQEKNRTGARIKKPTLAARSPFNERAVRLTAKANIVDRELYYWVLSTTTTNKDDVVYKDSFKETLHGEFQSLAPFKRVSPAIVDTWSSYLNNMEQLKAPETVSRLFFSTNPCKKTVVDAPTEWNAKQKLDTFWTRLFGEALGMSILQWETFDMIFFPIWGAAQEYVICFDLPDGKMNIIDHSFPEPDASVEAKYGKTPFLLKKFFSEALTRCKVPKMAAQVRKCRTHVVTMPWRNSNLIDEGRIYVMRHMETYFGESEKDWECGLGPSGTKSVEMFRIKYARTLLTCIYNTRGGDNQKKATRFWKEKPAKFKFENWVDLYGIE
ncbi:uncharacterized protein LOC121760177 [Salvia splendens]|uniref:uncharacterized protein LOC121760177 n=1 Tax=Salvia splendens TaxID=180675 RepID=UPI001C2812B6|nr:uncharacterized protein LOC121760177 [Salvia splendens]